MRDPAIIAGNRITLLKNGAEFFPALEAAIDRAQFDIRIETYIFEEDASGIRIANALKRAASRGVSVRVLVDGFGSRATSAGFFESIRATGVTLLFFRPERGWLDFRKSRVRRVHRKIVLIDGKQGFVGGINLIDDFTENLSDTAPRYDYAVAIEGPILAPIYLTVHRLWRIVKWFSLKRRGPEFAMPKVSSAPVGNVNLSFVARDNFRHRRDIENAYLKAIGQAKQEVLIASPYFLPGRRLRRALKMAARRGVSVHVLLQGRADHPMMQLATQSLYGVLFKVGVKIYEYQPAMLHGKVAVIDHHWATVGSSNLDPFSLLLNREANIIAHDKDFAATLHASVMEEIRANAIELDAARWEGRSVLAKLKSWLALTLARVFTGVVGVKHD
jgi:cardiolipin synthase A/B